MSRPPSSTRPVSGCSKPAIIRSVVVLPEPDGPSSVKNSPSPTVRSTSSTATTSPYVLRAPSTRTSPLVPSADKAPLKDVEPALEILVADGERHEDADHVAVETAREEHQPLPARGGGDARRLLAGLLGQFDRHHRPEPAHLGPLGRHRLEPLAQPAPDRLRARPRLLEGVEDRDRGGALHRVPAERPAEPARRDRVHDLGAAGDAGERQPAAERLAADEQVGLDVVVLDRPDGAGAPAPRLHLVVDVEDPVAVEQLLQALREVR